MPLTPGDRLGAYEIAGSLGAGGMGEVYKARDHRLGRMVAIKVLPASAASSPEARARLTREARTLSQLSDPHICALFDIGEHEGREYLVMELLDGETLSTRLARGALPLDQVLKWGIEIALALDKAHRHGIVHRDLKPGNIMLTSSGVKLLDFGLAKPTTPVFPASVESATMSGPDAMTVQGTILGTLQYMAPEQLEGRAADERSDIFAFGAVLYEMATGKAAFAAASSAAIVSAIMHSEPPRVSTLQPAAPPALDSIISTCLAKEPERRWRSSHDVALQLESMRGVDGRKPSSAVTSRRAPGWWLPWMVAAIAIVTAAGTWLLRTAVIAGPAVIPIRFSIPPPDGGAFAETVETVTRAISPDGSTVAFVAWGRAGPSSVWLRRLSAIEATPLAGTEGASSVFWSPDGQQLGFFAGSKLQRIQISGGGPVPVCDIRQGVGYFGTWGRDGRILFASVQGEAIYRASTAGNAPEEIIKRDPEHGVVRVTWPTFLPDGVRFLHLKQLTDGSLRLMLVEPDAQSREIAAVGSNVQYVDPGYLLFARDATLLAQRFDASRGRFASDPFAVADDVTSNRSTGSAQFTASRNGVVVYQSHRDQQRIAWVDRSGKETARVEPSAQYQLVRISPDGRQIVFDRGEARTGTPNVWVRDLERGVDTMLTSDPGSEVAGVWLPGGTSLVYSADRGGPPHLFRRDLTTGADQELLPADAFDEASDVSPDGKWLIYDQRARGSFNIRLLPLTPASGAPPPRAATPWSELGGRCSPDGRYIAFMSSETGPMEVYVAPFPGMQPRTAVSAGGGTSPRWSHDGHELFYLASAGVMSVPVRTSPSLSIGVAVNVVPVPPDRAWVDYDVAPDGRFVAIIPEVFGQRQPMTVIVNWITQAGR
jgi:eukaryotic-like serine/threonine-protein kinase